MPETYYTPQAVAEQGIKAVHQRPYCAGEDSHILGRFDSEYAWATFPKLELNPAQAYAAIILDCDSDSIDRREVPGKAWWGGGTPTPTPSWMVINERPRSATRRAGGIHCVYALEVPVARHDGAHTLPLAYLAHVADRLSYHLGADPGYQGLITRNPLRPGEGCFTHWSRMFPYTLGELDKLLPKGKPPSRRQTGIGRNCDLFRAMVSEVFRPRWAGILGAQGWSPWLGPREGSERRHVRARRAARLRMPVYCQVLFPVLDKAVLSRPFQRPTAGQDGQTLAWQLRLQLRPASPERARTEDMGIEAIHHRCSSGVVSGSGL